MRLRNELDMDAGGAEAPIQEDRVAIGPVPAYTGTALDGGRLEVPVAENVIMARSRWRVWARCPQ